MRPKKHSRGWGSWLFKNFLEMKSVTNFEDYIYEVLAGDFSEPAEILGDTAIIGGFHIALNRGIEVSDGKEVKAFNKVGKAIKYLHKCGLRKKRGLRKRSTNPSFHEIIQQYFSEVEARSRYSAIVRTPHPWLLWWSRKDNDYRFKASTTFIESIIIGGKKQQLPYRHTLTSHSLHELCKAILKFPKSTKHIETKRSELRASDITQEVDPLRRKWVFKEKLLNITIIEFDIPYRRNERQR